MRIAIVGYGKMGRMIDSLISAARKHTISAVIDPYSDSDEVTAIALDSNSLASSDVVIDFSSPKTAVENMLFYAENGIPAVIGTTGWYERLPEISEKLEKGKMIYSGNFSLGVAIFMHLVTEAGKLLNNIPSYDVAISEVHHREKADAPSGTALMAANRLLDTLDRKTGLQIGNAEGKIDKSKINISSMRLGSVPGIHSLMIDGNADTIEIKHTARTREGFAEGAIKAAEWLVEKPSGLYTMDDFISELIGGRQ